MWTTGAASAAQAQPQHEDDDIEPYDSDFDKSSELSIDEDTKTKCAQAQARDSNGLFTLQLTTYQVAILNTKLSQFKMRLEPSENVLQTLKKREKERRTLEREQMKQREREEKERLKQIEREQKILDGRRKNMFNMRALQER